MLSQPFDTIVSANFSRWVENNPVGVAALLFGYKDILSNMANNLVDDARVLENDHLLNVNFSQEPKFFMGYRVEAENNCLVMASLFVFPKHRKMGHAKNLIKDIQAGLGRATWIRLEVEESKVSGLDSFYSNLNFTKVEGVYKDPFGKSFANYVWAGRPYKTRRNSDGSVGIMALD